MQYIIYATQDYMGGWTGEIPELPGFAPDSKLKLLMQLCMLI